MGFNGPLNCIKTSQAALREPLKATAELFLRVFFAFETGGGVFVGRNLSGIFGVFVWVFVDSL